MKKEDFSRSDSWLDSSAELDVMTAKPRTDDALIVLHAQSLASLESSRKLGRLVPAWIISAIVHVVLLAFFLIIPYRSEGETTETEGAVFDAVIEAFLDRGAELLNGEKVVGHLLEQSEGIALWPSGWRRI